MYINALEDMIKIEESQTTLNNFMLDLFVSIDSKVWHNEAKPNEKTKEEIIEEMINKKIKNENLKNLMSLFLVAHKIIKRLKLNEKDEVILKNFAYELILNEITSYRRLASMFNEASKRFKKFSDQMQHNHKNCSYISFEVARCFTKMMSPGFISAVFTLVNAIIKEKEKEFGITTSEDDRFEPSERACLQKIIEDLKLQNQQLESNLNKANEKILKLKGNKAWYMHFKNSPAPVKPDKSSDSTAIKNLRRLSL